MGKWQKIRIFLGLEIMSEIERSYLQHETEGVYDAVEHMIHDLPSVSAERIFDYWIERNEEVISYEYS
jgi:hypothetical protein